MGCDALWRALRCSHAGTGCAAVAARAQPQPHGHHRGGGLGGIADAPALAAAFPALRVLHLGGNELQSSGYYEALVAVQQTRAAAPDGHKGHECQRGARPRLRSA